jgi:hypothetical protein
VLDLIGAIGQCRIEFVTGDGNSSGVGCVAMCVGIGGDDVSGG